MVCCLPPLSPANNPNSKTDVVDFKMPDCEECERIMTGAISKFKGVESCVTDTENQKIKVTGSFNLEKLVKKVMKVTGKEVEIVKPCSKKKEVEIVEKPGGKLGVIPEVNEETDEKEKEEKDDETESQTVQRNDGKLEVIPEVNEETDEKENELETILENEKEKELETILENDEKSEEDAKPETVIEPNSSDESKEIEKYMMFSEENPNDKCTIS